MSICLDNTDLVLDYCELSHFARICDKAVNDLHNLLYSGQNTYGFGDYKVEQSYHNVNQQLRLKMHNLLYNIEQLSESSNKIADHFSKVDSDLKLN